MKQENTLDAIILVMVDKAGLNNVQVSTPFIDGITLHLYIKQHCCSVCTSRDMRHIDQGSAARDQKTQEMLQHGRQPSILAKETIKDVNVKELD